jgi:hypothetical protein
LVFALALRRRPSLGGGAINLDRARAVDACEWMTIDDMTNASVAHFISLPAPNATAADRGKGTRIVFADDIVDVAEFRQFPLDRVVKNRQSWNLDDPALDRVEQAEVRDHPRKKRALVVAGATQENGVAERS